MGVIERDGCDATTGSSPLDSLKRTIAKGGYKN